ncbi:MAG: DUF92 domain-containing protein [Vicinamibacterales bacterium]
MIAARGSNDDARQWVHIGFGAAAMLLRYLPWWQAVVLAAAAVMFNIRLLHHVARGRLHRPHELDQRVPVGLVLYPTSIVILLLLLPSRPDIVAASWGILAAGDGAATLVGRRHGVRKWPWNRQKSVAGSTALFLAGGLAGSFLAWWCRPAVIPPAYLWFSVAAPLVAALAAAAVETAPIRLDDNLSVPLTAAAVLWALSLINEDLAQGFLLAAPPALAIAIPANGAVAWAGYAARIVSKSGAISGAIIGTVIYLCTGWPGWVLLLAAFACAAITSRMGLRRKVLLGIAEAHGGRRGAGNAIANTGVAAVAAILSVVSFGQVDALIAFTAALTAGASDTIASEIGKAWGRGTWAILPPRPVPPGTSGAVSFEGTAAGLIGAGALATLAMAVGLIPGQALVPVVGGATVSSLVESLLGAAFEGSGVLNNDALNLINTGSAAFVAVSLAGVLP